MSVSGDQLRKLFRETESPAVPRLPPLPLPCAESSSPPPAANPPPSGNRFLVPHVRAPPLTLRDPPGRPIVPPAARALPAPPRPERPRGCSPLPPGCSWPRGCGAASGPPRRSQLLGFPGAPGPGGARPVLLGAAGAAAPPAGPGASLQPRRCRCLRGPSPARRAPRCSSRPGPAAAETALPAGRGLLAATVLPEPRSREPRPPLPRDKPSPAAQSLSPTALLSDRGGGGETGQR